MIKSRDFRVILVLGMLTVSSIVGGFWLQQRFGSPPNPYAQLGGDFTLMSASGPVSLSDYRGKVVMLFFGFTSCPDVCPTDLSRMSAVFNALNSGEVEKVAGLFVSVDPERDTPIQVSEYAAFFDKRITGVTGSPDEVAAVARQFYVLYNRVDIPDSAMGYTIDHSASTYLIDKKGKVIQLIKHDESVQTMVQAVRDVLAR